MHSPAAKASVERVASGDHSLDAIAQLLICLSECFESQSRKIDDIRLKIGNIDKRYDDCPARVQQAAPKKEALPAPPAPAVNWHVIIKYVLYIVYALILLLASALGVKVAAL